MVVVTSALPVTVVGSLRAAVLLRLVLCVHREGGPVDIWTLSWCGCAGLRVTRSQLHWLLYVLFCTLGVPGVCSPTSTPTSAAQDMVREVANTTRKDIRIGISASALVCRRLRQPSHGRHGRPCAPARQTHVRWVADICNCWK